MTMVTTIPNPGGPIGGPDAPPDRRTRGTQLDPAHERLCAMVYLIVGERRFARSMIKSALNGFGFRNLTECESSEHALKVVQGGGVDVILVEHEIPGTSGTEFVWRLRRLADERARRLPVVMFGNDAVAGHVHAAIDSGVNEYLPKPYSRRDFYARIRRAVLAPKPFVDTPRYVGPDRRVLDKGASHGSERRLGLPMSVQLHALAGSEPRWIRTAKLGPARPGEITEPPAHPPAGETPDRAAAGTAASPTVSEPKGRPSFSALAETDLSGRGSGRRFAALLAKRPGAEPNGEDPNGGESLH